MAFSLIPREVRFFDLLDAQAAVVVRGARLLLECMETKTTLGDIYLASKKIHEVEHEGDELVHQLLGKLNKSFITPFDREDIYELCVRMDDILDYVDVVAKRLVTYQIASPTPHAVELARIIFRSSEEVLEGIRLLRDLRRHDEIIRQCARINQLENDGDQAMRDGLNLLFNSDPPRDPLEVIKWKDLYEHLEIATDKCEDVANIMEAVLVKYS